MDPCNPRSLSARQNFPRIALRIVNSFRALVHLTRKDPAPEWLNPQSRNRLQKSTHFSSIQRQRKSKSFRISLPASFRLFPCFALHWIVFFLGALFLPFEELNFMLDGDCWCEEARSAWILVLPFSDFGLCEERRLREISARNKGEVLREPVELVRTRFLRRQHCPNVRSGPPEGVLREWSAWRLVSLAFKFRV